MPMLYSTVRCQCTKREGKPKLKAEQVAQLKARVATGVPKARVAREIKISLETLYTNLEAAEPAVAQ